MTREEFIKEWKKLRIRIACDEPPRKNWKAIERRKKELVEIWNKKFRSSVRTIVCNNTDLKNYHQFIGFEI